MLGVSSSVSRVPAHTASQVNERIKECTRERIERYMHAAPGEIERRLRELDREWDIERAIEANAASISLVGIGLAAGFGRKWLTLPAAVAAFLLQHSVQGWCPPVPIMRRLGFRTVQEIEEERYALKALRGDFEGFSDLDAAEVHARVTH